MNPRHPKLFAELYACVYLVDGIVEACENDCRSNHLIVVELGQQLRDGEMLLWVAVRVPFEGSGELLDAQINHTHHYPLMVRVQPCEDVRDSADAGPGELPHLGLG